MRETGRPSLPLRIAVGTAAFLATLVLFAAFPSVAEAESAPGESTGTAGIADTPCVHCRG